MLFVHEHDRTLEIFCYRSISNSSTRRQSIGKDLSVFIVVLDGGNLIVDNYKMPCEIMWWSGKKKETIVRVNYYEILLQYSIRTNQSLNNGLS